MPLGAGKCWDIAAAGSSGNLSESPDSGILTKIKKRTINA